MTEASIPAFQKAIQLNEKFAEAHFHLGLAYDRTGRIADAIAQYQEALCLKPELAEARYGLSSICVRAGDLNGAIRLLRQVIEAAPNFSEARYNLALNLWNRYKKSTELRLKSDLDEAVQELLAASRLEPRQPKIHAALGRILAERQDRRGNLGALWLDQLRPDLAGGAGPEAGGAPAILSAYRRGS